MSRFVANDFQRELPGLYSSYVHGRIGRHDFLDRTREFAVGGLTAEALLTVLSPDYALALQVQSTDTDIFPGHVRYLLFQGHGYVRGDLVSPTRTVRPVSGVVVVDRNRGFNPCVEGRTWHGAWNTTQPRAYSGHDRRHDRR